MTSALALSLAIATSSSPQLADSVLLDADEKPVDTHAKTFKIAAHIRDAEATLLHALRQQELARNSHSEAAPPASPRSQSTTASSSNSNSSASLAYPSEPIAAHRLAAVHNAAWKHAAVTSRHWYEQRAELPPAAAAVAQFEAANRAAADDDALLALDPAAVAVLAGVPKSTKLARLIRSMQFAEQVSLSPVPHAAVLAARAAGSAAPITFGVALERVPLVGSPRWGRVPLLVADCLDWLADSGQLGVEGVFRLSGAAQAVQQLHDRYERADVERGALDLAASDTTVHTVANLLKLFLRKLPEPLVPQSLYPLLMLVYETTHRNEAALTRALRGALGALRELPCGWLLAALCNFFRQHVAVHAEQSSMTCANLAIMVAPSVLRADGHRDNAAAEASRIVPALVACMIARSDVIFPHNHQQNQD